ncbi:hypothetical protein GYMLUDRAFT_37363 [Collybiopsis luxurians FD-317 M1]|nr:hypothetical protein GYMLUDRAFT_37363 [Collybiopsis luxurians FD-317 M1]
MEARLSAAVLGLLTTGCEAFFSRRREQQYVWRKPFQLTVVRCLFILARYPAFLIHIANIALSSVAFVRFAKNGPPTEQFCMVLLIFDTTSSYNMSLILQLILMLRAYALYDRSIRIGVLLAMLLAGRLAWSLVTSIHAFRSPSTLVNFDGHCLPRMDLDYQLMQNPVVAFVYGELVVQCIVHGLAWKRTMWDFRRLAFFQPTLFSVLNRDGLKVFVGIGAVMIATNVGAVKVGVPSFFVFPLLVSLTSFLGTRTILNLHALHESEAQSASPEINKEMELTTVNFTAWFSSTISNPSQGRPGSRTTIETIQVVI